MVLAINPKNIHGSFVSLRKRDNGEQVGEIFGVQSKKIFLVKLFEDRTWIKKFDVAKFNYSMQDSQDLTITGIVFDTYLLNQEKWAKVLQLGDPSRESGHLEKNVVNKLEGSSNVKAAHKALRVDDLVGIVIEGSTIGKLKFEYSKMNDDLQEGDLLELKVAERRLFYQVVGGNTKKEKLEARNETGYIEGEAMQLGEWQHEKLSFQKFGWVPSINTPIFKANTADLTVDQFDYPYFQLGVIPDTTLPSVIDLSDAISHHTAFIGVTGCGKSFITQQIIEHILVDTKVICIDFTGEWKKKLDASKYQIITENDVESYLTNADQKIGLFELPTLSNTTDVLKETQTFLEKVFNFAKKKYDES
ncbi:MAG: helicase HerA domain-containing protein, partial [Acidobacteriota bacterium]